tara:strand:- start:253 stop:816 length:564 start_codon:yes stop_codon:yes gene_type:complete
VLKERIREVFEFTKSESPYRRANKGWINKDIFLDLSPSADKLKQKNEAVKVTLFWSPVDSLLSNIFLIIVLGSLLVFTSIYFAKGRFNFETLNYSAVIDSAKVENDKVSNVTELEDLDSTNSKIEQNLITKDSSESNNINVLDDDLMNEDQKIKNEQTDENDSLIKKVESEEVNNNLQKKMPKSNFI